MQTQMNQTLPEQNQNESLRSSGKTVDEAIEQGLKRLKLSQDQVVISVIKQGSRGILGLGAEDAVVLLTPRPVKPVVLETPAPAEPVAVAEEAPSVPVPVAVVPALAEAAPASKAAPAVNGFDPQVAERAREILHTLLDKMGIPADVTARVGHDLIDPGEKAPLILDITGHDLGLLIGRRGETLRALQFVTRQILNKELGYWVPVVVDVESYLVRRRKTLQQLALRMADRVVFSGRKVVLEPMPSLERRIIHMQLRDHQQVYTNSTGEGENRKVVILPK